jgi:hypothetical protein
MPDILSDDDLSPLAAEYVLGTLDSDERTRANVLLDVDHQFRGMVRIWERRLGELHLMVEPVEPDAKIYERIKGKLKNVAPPAAVAPPPAETQADAKPSPAKPANSNVATTTEQKLAGLVLEVERIAESAKSDPKAADVKVAEVKTGDAVAAAKPMDVAAVQPEPKPDEPKAEGTPAVDAVSMPAAPQLDVAGESKDELKSGEPDVAPSKVSEFSSLESELAAITEANIAEGKSKEPKPADLDQAEGRMPERISREVPPVLIPAERRDVTPRRVREARPAGVGRWRAYSVLMTLVAIGLGGLIAAWRYVPERLPPQLRPTAVLKLPETSGAPIRKPAPPESQFDE